MFGLWNLEDKFNLNNIGYICIIISQCKSDFKTCTKIKKNSSLS